MPKIQGPTREQLKEKAANYPGWATWKPKNTIKGICQFLSNNGDKCDRECEENANFCGEHAFEEPKPKAQPKKQAALKKQAPAQAAPAQAAPAQAAQSKSLLQSLQAKFAPAPAPAAAPAAPAPAAPAAAAPAAPVQKFLLKKKQGRLYNPAPIGELPRYIENTPSQVIFYAPKVPALIENIMRLNEQSVFKYPHLIIGDTLGISALEVTSGLMAAEVPLVQIQVKGNGYEMFYRDRDAAKIVVIATYKDRKVEILGGQAPEGVLLVSRKWPFVGKDEQRAADMKAFSLAVMNSFENKFGSLIRYIVLDSEYREGTDVFNVKYIHLFSPMAKAAERVQAVGRGVRRCGQRYMEFVPGEGWTVEVFIYATDLEVVPGQTEVAELALAPPEDEKAKIGALINESLYTNAISQVLWECKQVEFAVVPSQRDAEAYFQRLAEWISQQSERGINKAELDVILADMNKVYNDINEDRTNIDQLRFREIENPIYNALEDYRYYWDDQYADGLFETNNLLERINTVQGQELQNLFTRIKALWSQIPPRKQREFYAALAQKVNVGELTPPIEVNEIPQIIARNQPMPALPLPTIERLAGILEELPEENYWLQQLRNTYEPGYQFPGWILLTQQKQGRAELWLQDKDEQQAALLHSYRRVPSLDPDGTKHYSPSFDEIFWDLDSVANAPTPLYAIYTLSQVARQQGCDVSEPELLGQAHILHVFDQGNLVDLSEMIKYISRSKNLQPYVPVPTYLTRSEKEEWIGSWQETAAIIYGPIEDVNLKGLLYDWRDFLDIFVERGQQVLFVNDWNRLTMIGNGNCGQESLDAQIGRSTNSIALGWPGSNPDIKNQVKIFELEF